MRGALSDLRSAQVLLPSDSRQYAELQRRIAHLSDRVDAGEDAARSTRPQNVGTPPESAAASKRPRWVVAGSAIGAAGLLAWKFKFVVVFLFTKAKLLLLGLSKSTTLFTMLLSFSLYWTIWGWAFALGLVLSIYVHEMGHVSALRRFGIAATAPMFIPGFGALVRLDQYPQTAREDARVGLAGPIWGLGASVACLAVYGVTENALFAAVGTVGAWINLFNLLPLWQLDGGRGFRAMSQPQRWLAVAAIALAWALTQEGLLLLLLLAAGFRAFTKGPEPGDRRALLQYGGLVVVLALLSAVPVPH